MERRVRLVVVLVVVVALLAPPALAEPRRPSNPTDEVRRHVERLIALAGDPSLGPEHRQVAVTRATAEAFDLPEFARRALGSSRERMSRAEQADFVDALATLLAEFYIRTLSRYGGDAAPRFGNRIRFVGESVARNEATVRMMVSWHRHEVPVQAKLLARMRGWRIYDLVINGVTITENYRAQIGRVLHAGTPQDLMALVGQKRAALAFHRSPEPVTAIDYPPR